MLIDTHAHLTMPEFQDISEVMERAKNAGVVKIIDVGYDLESSARSVALAKDFDNIYCAVGVHPHDAKTRDKDTFKALKLLAQRPKVVAIGESGLDYHYKLSSPEEQKGLFIGSIKLAIELDLPLIIHGRESYEDIIDILETEGKGMARGVFHSFSGDIRQSQWAVENGFLISLSGMLTFSKAKNITDIALSVPIGNIILETDCPYLTPEPFRGKRNEPSYIRFIAEKLAKIKGISYEEVGKVTTQNAEKLFRIG